MSTVRRGSHLFGNNMAGKINNRQYQRTEGTGDLSMPVLARNYDSNTFVFLCPPDPNWSKPTTKTVFNTVICDIMEELSRFNISSYTFLFSRQPIINNNYDHFIRQASLAFDYFLRFFEGKINANSQIIIIGYSFGGVIGKNLAFRRPEVKYFCMIDPPLLNYDCTTDVKELKQIQDRGIRGLIVYSNDKSIIETTNTIPPVAKRMEDYAEFFQKNRIDVDLEAIDGANYTFDNHRQELCKIIIDFITG